MSDGLAYNGLKWGTVPVAAFSVNVSEGARLLYVFLFTYANPHTSPVAVFPSQSRLASQLGITEGEVRKRLRELQENGLLRSVRRVEYDRGFTGNPAARLYFLNLPPEVGPYPSGSPDPIQADSVTLSKRIAEQTMEQTKEQTKGDDLASLGVPSLSHSGEDPERPQGDDLSNTRATAGDRGSSTRPLDVAHFPADVRGVLATVARLWGLEIPQRGTSDHGDWILAGRELIDIAGYLGFPAPDIPDLLALYREEWGKRGDRHTVSRPGSLVGPLGGFLGQLATEGQSA